MTEPWITPDPPLGGPAVPTPDDCAPSPWVFHIERPLRWENLPDEVILEGWCFGRRGRPVAAVRAMVNDTIFYGDCGRPRRDVETAHQDLNAVSQSGFWIRAEFPPGPSTLRIQTLQDTQWVTLFETATQRPGKTPKPRWWHALAPSRPQLQRTFDQGPPDYEFHIETPTDVRVEQREIIVRGWCFRTGRGPVLSVRGVIGTKTFLGTYGKLRSDVFVRYLDHEKALRSGFEIKLHAPLGDSQALIEAHDLHSGWRRLGVINVHCKPPSLLVAGQRWSKFLRSFRGNFAQSWAALGPRERDWLSDFLENRQCLTLGKLSQYEPRPLRHQPLPPARSPRKELPKITIVTPSYNQAPYLRQTMESVLRESGVSVDYIVQDGGSSDGSAQIIAEYEKRLHHWTSSPDKGQSAAIRAGFEHMNCRPDDIMAYLNSDDVLAPGALPFVADYFARHPDIDVVYGHRVLIDENDQEIGRWITPQHDLELLRYIDFVPQETMFWRRRIYDRVGGIDSSFKFALDWDILLRFAAAGAKMARLPYFMGCFRVHASQKTSAQINQVGAAEMDSIRRSIHGRPLSQTELHEHWNRGLVESALLAWLLRCGIPI